MKETNVKDFVFFASPFYKVLTGEVDGIEVNSYYKNSKNVAERMLNDVLSAMAFMNKAVGKYPFKEFDIVESNIVGFAMEYPTIIQMGEYKMDLTTSSDENNLIWFDEAVVHEMIHQWFFNIVGNDCFSEPILDETLTVLWTGNYFRYQYGAINPNSALENEFVKNYSSDLLPINRAVDKFKYNDYIKAIYHVGWRVFEDIRLQIGDDKFVEVFRNYFNKYRFKNASVDNLLDEFENVCGKDIRNYVNKAINTKNYDLKKTFLFVNDDLKTVENGFIKDLDIKLVEADEKTKKDIVDNFDNLINDINSGKDTMNDYFVNERYNELLKSNLLEMKSCGDISYDVYDVYTEENNLFTVIYAKLKYGNNHYYVSIKYDGDNKIVGYFY